MAAPSDPVANVWRSSELLGCVAPFLDPSHAAWSFIRVNKAAAAAAYGDSGQPVPRTVSLSWALSSGLFATLEGRLHARNWCYHLTYKQRVKLLCRAAAADCSRESLEGAVVAAGLSPPPLKVLVAAASAGRLATCRWLVEGLGCPGLVRLACLCLISAAGPGPGVVEEARAWLAPAALEGWSEEQEAEAAAGDLEAVKDLLLGWEPEGVPYDHIRRWRKALKGVQARRDLERTIEDVQSWSRFAMFRHDDFIGRHAALAVARLTRMQPAMESSAAVASCTLSAAAGAGHTEAVRFLLSRGARPSADLPNVAAVAASRRGHVGVLQALHEGGCVADPARCFRAGLEAGSLPVVEWLVGTFGAPAFGAGGSNYHLTTAARSGDVQLLRALPGLLGSAFPGWGRGSCCGDAAASGCEEAVEWLAKEAGVPQEYHNVYRDAASRGDLRMVQRLRRLGCPYSARDAEALAEAARRGGAKAEAQAVTLLNRVVNLSLVASETKAAWASLTGDVDPCGPGLQAWGCVWYCLLLVVLPVAAVVAWLYVKRQPLRKRAFWVPIAFALTHMVVALIGGSESIRLAMLIGYRLVKG
ncbi:hypothetical protein HYH03_007539 [Edaphochlamys debaryana]|uniref:Uncharacterized protein n=1 Tax=Edaphochlamys debaryana TaxID=47281 RepID=A0A835Y4U7_9CHLO|nr:hypothetical protein HYH03_007539 [Edaphochlamys debaryana]|eukprot:KAG2494181.1 hypothetical protein HYH03_007539 [Edaphochlamys debaryana]